MKKSGQTDIVWSEFNIQARLFFFGVRVSMQSVGIYEAKSRFSALIELVEQGEEVRITRHGKEVVRMLPVFGFDDAPHGHAEVILKNVTNISISVKKVSN